MNLCSWQSMLARGISLRPGAFVGRVASVYAGEDEEYQRVRWLADFKVVGISIRGDSALATTVADQVETR